MGKKQHQKDKLYLTSKEWKEDRGGFKKKELPKYFRLPFECCSLSLQPYRDPCCNSDGYIFDMLHAVAFIEKFGIDPISGKPAKKTDLIKLNIAKNNQGKYHCPMTRKEFSDSVHVVAIRTSGNVYAFDAIQELNYSLNNFKDLISDTPFTKKDVITLQNPADVERLNCAKFHHIVNNLKVEDEKDDDIENLRNICPETLGALDELEKTYKPPTITFHQKETKKATARNAAHYSTGHVAYGFTCTTFEPKTQQTPGIIDDDQIRYPRIKKKGYVQLVTNLGNLNLQLHCDLVPKACENFLKLCQANYYNDTLFFRLAPGHMVQGGDPTGTGNGGQSAFGKPFKDEIRANMRHDQRGILSMANHEKNQNTSQFFITFNQCPSFDDRFTIFGKVVGGLDVLNKIENVPIDEEYHPLINIKIVSTNVFSNPFDELDAELEQSKNKPVEEKPKENKEEIRRLKESSTVGKYIKKKSSKQ